MSSGANCGTGARSLCVPSSLAADSTLMDPAPSTPVRCELDSLFELAPDLLAVGGTDGRLARTNPAWADALGWDAAELSGRPFIDLVHPADQERTLAVLANV